MNRGRRFPHPTIVFDAWPAIERERFLAGTETWGHQQRKVAQTARGQWLGLARARDLARVPTQRGFEIFRDVLLEHKAANTARRYLAQLHAVMQILRPDLDWSWMPAVYQDLLRTGRKQVREMKRERRIKGLPVEAWPAPIRDAWQRAMAGEPPAGSGAANLDADLAALLGPTATAGLAQAAGDPAARPAHRKAPAEWVSVTQRDLGYKLGRYLATLRQLGREETLTEPSFLAWIEATEPHISPLTLWSDANGLRRIAVALWPDKDWTWLRRHVALLAERARAAPRPTKKARLVGAHRLCEVANALIAEARSGAPGRDKAVLFRDGMTMRLLLVLPLRRRNVLALERGQSLSFDPETGRGAINSPHSKNGEAILRDLTADLVSLVDEWWHRVRPILATRESGDHLLIGRSGAPLARESLTWSIRERTGKALGVKVSPQAFRNNVASAIAEHLDDESALDLASYHLGHRARESARPYIEHAPHLVATRALHEALRELERLQGRGDGGA